MLILALAAPAGAGEVLFENGSRLQGELANEVLLVSTGSDLLEIAPDQVSALTRDEIRLKDGRVIRGVVVGGQVKVRTALGEIAVRTEELRGFHSEERAVASPAPTGAPIPAAAPTAPAAGPAAPAMTPQPARRPEPTARAAALAAPDPVVARLEAVPAPATPTAAASREPGSRRRFEVVAGESALHRDAVAAASSVGRVVRGEQVTYLDSIDRRLRILDTLIFDGGYWIKVRAADGTVGWLPAETLRELR